MAAVAQKMKPSKTEVSVGDETKSLTKEESKVFVKRMLAICTSNITYLRQLFPDSAYSNRTIPDTGMKLKILKENVHDGASKVVEWMHGAYDAIDKEYLKELIFAIVRDPDDPTSVIETYSHAITYENGSLVTTVKVGENKTKILKVPTIAETKASTKTLLRQLVLLTSNLDDLPKNVFMTMRLLYDESTPDEYQPPGFTDAAEEDRLQFKIPDIRIKVGTILTPHNTLKLRARTSKEQFVKTCDENSSQPVQMEVDSPNKDFGVRCPCGDDEDDDLMIQCSHCSHWQHAVCFCVYNDSVTPSAHTCHVCYKTALGVCTDPSLVTLSADEQKFTCLWRRLLQVLFDEDTITVAKVIEALSCSRPLAQKLLKQLIDKNVVSVLKNQKKPVNNNMLKKIFQTDVKDRFEINLTTVKALSKDVEMQSQDSQTSVMQEIQNGEKHIKFKAPLPKPQNKRALEDWDTQSQLSVADSQTSVDAFVSGETSRKRPKMSKQIVPPIHKQ